MARYINGNETNTYSSYGDVSVGTSKLTTVLKDYYRLKILFDDIINQLQPPKAEYILANFDDFVNNWDDDFYITVSSLLNNDNTFFYNNETTLLSNYDYDEDLVTNYRSMTNRLINVLKQSISEYYKIKTLEEENVQLQSYKDILEDREKLLEYVAEIQKTSFLFSAQATYSNDLEIKLWYKEYLERYGPPGDGIFDTELLADIIKELYESGQIDSMEYIY